MESIYSPRINRLVTIAAGAEKIAPLFDFKTVMTIYAERARRLAESFYLRENKVSLKIKPTESDPRLNRHVHIAGIYEALAANASGRDADLRFFLEETNKHRRLGEKVFLTNYNLSLIPNSGHNNI